VYGGARAAGREISATKGGWEEDFAAASLSTCADSYVPSSTEFKNTCANSVSPKKADRTRYRYAARKGVREFGFGLAMDPREAGKLGAVKKPLGA